MAAAAGRAIRKPTAPLARAMSYLRRRWMVPAANISSWRTSTMRPLISAGVRLEFLRRAAAEIDHLGGEAVLRRGDGAHQRMAGGHACRRPGARSRASPASRCRARGSSARNWPARPPAPARAAARRPASRSSVPASRPPQSQMSLKSRHRPASAASRAASAGASRGASLIAGSPPASTRAIRGRRPPAPRARGRGGGRRRSRRGSAGSNGRATRPRWPKLSADSGSTSDQPVPAATRPQQLAKNSASTTALSCAPAAAKVPWTRLGICSERAGATIGWPDSSVGVSTLRAASGWRGGRMATQRIW